MGRPRTWMVDESGSDLFDAVRPPVAFGFRAVRMPDTEHPGTSLDNVEYHWLYDGLSAANYGAAICLDREGDVDICVGWPRREIESVAGCAVDTRVQLDPVVPGAINLILEFWAEGDRVARARVDLKMALSVDRYTAITLAEQAYTRVFFIYMESTPYVLVNTRTLEFPVALRRKMARIVNEACFMAWISQALIVRGQVMECVARTWMTGDRPCIGGYLPASDLPDEHLEAQAYSYVLDGEELNRRCGADSSVAVVLSRLRDLLERWAACDHPSVRSTKLTVWMGFREAISKRVEPTTGIAVFVSPADAVDAAMAAVGSRGCQGAHDKNEGTPGTDGVVGEGDGDGSRSTAPSNWFEEAFSKLPEYLARERRCPVWEHALPIASCENGKVYCLTLDDKFLSKAGDVCQALAESPERVHDGPIVATLDPIFSGNIYRALSHYVRFMQSQDGGPRDGGT